MNFYMWCSYLFASELHADYLTPVVVLCAEISLFSAALSVSLLYIRVTGPWHSSLLLSALSAILIKVTGDAAQFSYACVQERGIKQKASWELKLYLS